MQTRIFGNLAETSCRKQRKTHTLNRDYINPIDRRPIVSRANRPTVGRYFARFRKKSVGRWIFFYNYSVIISFPSADSFGVFVIGLAAADRRPTIGRLLMKSNPFKLGRLSADNRSMTFLSADHLQTVGRLN